MNVSLYQAAAAMNANARWEQAISENLASGSSPGARKQEVSFSAVEAGLVPGVSELNGGRFMIPAANVTTSFRSGMLRPTGLPTDLAVEGPGFIEVQLPNGSKAYTRDGELHISAQGQLVTKQGHRILGDNGPLQLDPKNSSPISVSSTGEVSQGGEVKGKIHVVDFDKPALLNNIEGGYFVADNPEIQKSRSPTSQLRQGFLETANSTPTTEMASLMTAMRMFEANQKVMQMQDDRMGRVITDLGTPA